MYSKIMQKAKSLLLLTALCQSYQLMAVEPQKNNAEMDIQPTSCISLREGRMCYATITIDWKTANTGDYCLYQSNHRIKCWEQTNGNKITFSFKSKNSYTYHLVEKNSPEVLAKATITVSWVHKTTPRKRRWRLF